MSVSPGRIVCTRCGANNFDTQAACWKCGAAVGSAAAAAAAPPVPPTPIPGSGAASSPVVPPLMSSIPVAPQGRPAAAANVDPATATWSAAALGLLFSFIAIPVGIVFLMLDDRRKVEIGKITILWGVVGSVLHVLFTAWMMRAAFEQIRAFLPGPAGQSQPKMTDEAPPIQFPGIPNLPNLNR